MKLHLTAMECHIPYGITQCYLPPDTRCKVLQSRWALDLHELFIFNF